MAGVSSQHAMFEDTTTRQWNFHAFEWVVRDVSRLRDHIENQPLGDGVEESDGDDDFEILKESPELGDSKFKLEISATHMNETVESDGASIPAVRAEPPRLCLHITCLPIAYTHPEYETSASMFAAIKCQDDRAGERGARAEWVWEHWQNNWTFRLDSEVWDCVLPPLSELLENPRIKETDSFVICVQMHSPVGPFYPQQPSAYYVPRDLLEGLEASLDNPNTGDVQFVCLERTTQQDMDAANAGGAPTSPRSTSSAQSTTTQTLARKRIIYAHSDILVRRSEYFATMLASSFAENARTLLPGERKVYTIVVEEADFVTVYWLLKWVYANWLLFRADDDPRQAVDGIGAGWSARDFGAPGVVDEWEWKAFRKGAGHGGSGFGASPSDTQSGGGLSDARSVTSGGSGRSTGEAMREKPKPITQTAQGMRTSHSGGTSSSKTAQTSPTSLRHQTPAPARRPSHGPSSGLTTAMANTPASPSTSRRTTAGAVPVAISPSASHFPHGSRGPRSTSGPAATADPHPHPTPPPPPASALSMYQVAHRYGMPGLGALALEHIVATITPRTSFAMLLASASWDELHTLIEASPMFIDYVVEKWDEVSVSEEFEQCCQEVASGEWGLEGGRTLTALFRRLRSPSAYGRN
ncbi:hypothetical protein PYCCODRAFT_1363847 [Trametes coccinea BRFM310]|uniref:BTB domain-containing protein n=1 Tax=Trametes coccinea (strain BRFM310) TaxID=1353009 RepID=A0A1Y2IVJ8_TRAC3|nr:hypothetical protein PYCCODRAFT_1363847 [Trametes coccinea BRFM310]